MILFHYFIYEFDRSLNQKKKKERKHTVDCFCLLKYWNKNTSDCVWIINKQKILLAVLRDRKSTADVLEDSLSAQGYFTNSLLTVTSHRRKDKGAHRGLFNKDTSPMY